MTDHHDEETKRLTGLGARPLHETKIPAVRAGGATFSVSQTTFADPEGNEFDLVTWQQQAEQGPSPSTNSGPIDDLGSAAASGGDPRSKVIKLAAGSNCELPCLAACSGLWVV